MAQINQISYQSTVAQGLQTLTPDDYRLAKVTAAVSRIATTAFGIPQDGQVNVTLTAKRLELVHNGTTHALDFDGRQLTNKGVNQADEIYTDFGYLQGLLKIESLPIASIAQPSILPTIERSEDGTTVNITLNLGGNNRLDHHHIESLTNLLKESFERTSQSQQLAYDTIAAQNRDLKQAFEHLSEQLPGLNWQLQTYRTEIEQLEREKAMMDAELKQVKEQLAAQNAAIDLALK